MSAIRWAVAAFLLTSAAHAQTRTLALYAEKPSGMDSFTFQSLQEELWRLLAPADVDLKWKEADQRYPGEHFDLAIVGSFDGSCAFGDSSSRGNVSSAPSGSLAHTEITSGRILPFFRVDCVKLTEMLEPALQRYQGWTRHNIAGRAVARVIAHEVYHILAKSVDHSDSGVAKPCFSVHDLTTDTFAFELQSLAEMRPVQKPRPAGSGGDALDEASGR